MAYSLTDVNIQPAKCLFAREIGHKSAENAVFPQSAGLRRAPVLYKTKKSPANWQNSYGDFLLLPHFSSPDRKASADFAKHFFCCAKQLPVAEKLFVFIIGYFVILTKSGLETIV